MPKNKSRVVVVKVLSWFLVMISLIVTTVLWFEFFDFLNNSEMVEAKVLEKKRSPGSNVSYDYTVMIDYEGNTYNSLLFSDEVFENGEIIRVYFLPDDLHKIKITSENSVFKPVASLLVVLLFLTVLIIAYVNPDYIIEHMGGDVFYGD